VPVAAIPGHTTIASPCSAVACPSSAAGADIGCCDATTKPGSACGKARSSTTEASSTEACAATAAERAGTHSAADCASAHSAPKAACAHATTAAADVPAAEAAGAHAAATVTSTSAEGGVRARCSNNQGKCSN
jgi:hypothetical protein